jgi:hypothetical protein
MNYLRARSKVHFAPERRHTPTCNALNSCCRPSIPRFSADRLELPIWWLSKTRSAAEHNLSRYTVQSRVDCLSTQGNTHNSSNRCSPTSTVEPPSLPAPSSPHFIIITAIIKHYRLMMTARPPHRVVPDPDPVPRSSWPISETLVRGP